jgi:hypothetical protein
MNAIFFGYIFGFLVILPLNVVLYLIEAPLYLVWNRHAGGADAALAAHLPLLTSYVDASRRDA